MTLPSMVARLAQSAILLGLASQAGAATGELARCAAIDAPEARLACYDRLAGRDAAPAPASVVGSSASPAPAAISSVVIAPVAAAKAEGAARSAANSAESSAQNFGLTPAQQHKAPDGPSSIQARITNLADRGGTPYVQLDNGQLWMVTDTGAEEWLNLGDPVTIKRAALGSFLFFTKSKR